MSVEVNKEKFGFSAIEKPEPETHEVYIELIQGGNTHLNNNRAVEARLGKIVTIVEVQNSSSQSAHVLMIL